MGKTFPAKPTLSKTQEENQSRLKKKNPRKLQFTKLIAKLFLVSRARLKRSPFFKKKKKSVEKALTKAGGDRGAQRDDNDLKPLFIIERAFQSELCVSRSFAWFGAFFPRFPSSVNDSARALMIHQEILFFFL